MTWKTHGPLPLFWSVLGCLRGHVHQTTILTKIPRPWTKMRLSFSFLRLPDTLSYICTLSISSINSYLIPSRLSFDFYPAYSQGSSWLIPWDPLWVLRPTLFTSLRGSAGNRPKAKQGYGWVPRHKELFPFLSPGPWYKSVFSKWLSSVLNCPMVSQYPLWIPNLSQKHFVHR